MDTNNKAKDNNRGSLSIRLLVTSRKASGQVSGCCALFSITELPYMNNIDLILHKKHKDDISDLIEQEDKK